MPFIQAILSLTLHSPATIPFFLSIFLVLIVTYRLFLHPLSHIPGPLLARISSLYLYTVCYLGIECQQIAHYHRKYNTSVLRVAPNAVSISNGAALHAIYVDGGGFKKDARYENFRVDGHATIFSTLDTAYRDSRAKAVLPLFAMGRVRAAGEGHGIIRECMNRFIERFESEKAKAVEQAPNIGAARVDALDLSQRLAIDVVTGYLFNKRYGGLDEQAVLLSKASGSPCNASMPSKMSAIPFVLAIVEFGRFSLLPNWLFTRILNLSSALGRLFPNAELNNSFHRVGAFATCLVHDADPQKDDTYQSRLLAAGVSQSETVAQCKAVTFAGTDSTATKLVTIIFHLVQNPSIHKRLSAELKVLGENPTSDPQTLSYLRAVIREGLRLGMANPARFTRIVPRGGFEVGGTYLPAGTSVGLAPYTLHHNPELFSEPFKFRPERWLDQENERLADDGGGGISDTQADRQKKERERDVIPFGVGSRMCIARNLATHELFMAVRALVESGVLEGARTCTKSIELDEWFNVGIKGHKVEVEWSVDQ